MVVLAALAGVGCSSSRSATSTSGATTQPVRITDTSGPADPPPGTGVALELSPLQGRPSAIVVGDGRVWVADDARGLVQRLDDRDGTFIGDPVDVGGTPTALALGGGSVWVADPHGTLRRIDPASGNPQGQPIPIGGDPTGLAFGEGGLWVTDLQASTLTRIDPVTGAIGKPIPIPGGAVRVAVGPGVLWVSNSEHTVTRVDPATFAVSAPVRVGAGPIGVTISQTISGLVLWVANGDDATVSRLDATTGAPLGLPIPVGKGPIEVVVSDRDAWVLDQDDEAVTHLSAGDGRRIGPDIHLHTRPRGLALVPGQTNGDRLWIAGVDPAAAVLIHPS